MSDEAQVFDNIDTFEKQSPYRRRTRKNKNGCKDSVFCLGGSMYRLPLLLSGLSQWIDIPLLLKSYNEAKLGGAWRLNSLKAVVQEKQPAACGMRFCKEHCPQGYDIPKIHGRNESYDGQHLVYKMFIFMFKNTDRAKRRNKKYEKNETINQPFHRSMFEFLA